METCINYTSPDTAWVSSDERRVINRIRKLQAEYPNEVVIKREPEQNDGCIYCTVPVSWIKISPPRKLNLSDEQRAVAAQRLRDYRRKGGDEDEGCQL